MTTTKKVKRADKKNDCHHLKRPIISAIQTGVNAPPNPVAAWMSPLARARSLRRIQLASARLKVG